MRKRGSDVSSSHTNPQLNPIRSQQLSSYPGECEGLCILNQCHYKKRKQVQVIPTLEAKKN